MAGWAFGRGGGTKKGEGMSEKPEALWIVTRIHRETKLRYVRKLFRTREAARRYAEYQAGRSKKYVFAIDRATWGPEQ